MVTIATETWRQTSILAKCFNMIRRGLCSLAGQLLVIRQSSGLGQKGDNRSTCSGAVLTRRPPDTLAPPEDGRRELGRLHGKGPSPRKPAEIAEAARCSAPPMVRASEAVRSAGNTRPHGKAGVLSVALWPVARV